tara:strand:- start:15 stop:761 length:747 start_codon:yes stop_codon:yes gene_type:complete
MNVAVIGVGFVGSAVCEFLESHMVNVWKVDPKWYPTTVFDVKKHCDAFILCLPTPSIDGKCDDSIIKKVIEQLDTEKPILLKSTVTPNLMQEYPSNVTYNPEFLRAINAKEDFKKQEVFILGGKNDSHITFWKNLFSNLNCNFITTNRTTASMIKYTHNAWLATKVAFFHELFVNLPKDCNYSELTSTLGQIKNIGPSHMIAPNFDGNLGYGGHCFPKDLEALTNYIDHSILQQVITTNKQLNKRSVR